MSVANYLSDDKVLSQLTANIVTDEDVVNKAFVDGHSGTQVTNPLSADLDCNGFVLDNADSTSYRDTALVDCGRVAASGGDLYIQGGLGNGRIKFTPSGSGTCAFEVDVTPGPGTISCCGNDINDMANGVLVDDAAALGQLSGGVMATDGTGTCYRGQVVMAVAAAGALVLCNTSVASRTRLISGAGSFPSASFCVLDQTGAVAGEVGTLYMKFDDGTGQFALTTGSGITAGSITCNFEINYNDGLL
tara:strand:- start:6358 stop:7098 length:741 start_codon:yes stop_codon:yes gene_type:complete